MTIELEGESGGRTASRLFDYLRSRADGIGRRSASARERRGAARGRSAWLPVAHPGVGGGERQPLAVAGLVAGAGLLVGAALAFRAKAANAPENPEEIVARALCHEDPDTPTHIGPLWAGYRKDARRVLAALREAGLLNEPG